MLRSLLICGLVAGLLGGLLATALGMVAGEPAIAAALALEGDAAEGPVSRRLQAGAGLLTASAVYGVALGGLFALVFALAYGRIARASPRVTAVTLAVAAFVVVYLVPFLKYPATPPGAADPETIGRRTALYGVMLAISVLCAVASVALIPAFSRLGSPRRTAVAVVLAYGLLVGAAGLALPSLNEVPSDFPAATLARFREASVGMQAVLWATIGAVFAFGAQRIMTGRSSVRATGA